MRVKIGDTWYEATPEAPIMIELTADDKRNISKMHPDATRYAVFAEGDKRLASEMIKWMDEGARHGPSPTLTF